MFLCSINNKCHTINVSNLQSTTYSTNRNTIARSAVVRGSKFIMNEKFQLAIEEGDYSKKPLNAFLVKNVTGDCVEQVDSTDISIENSPRLGHDPKSPRNSPSTPRDSPNSPRNSPGTPRDSPSPSHDNFNNNSNDNPNNLYSLKKSHSISDLPTYSHRPTRRYSVCDLNTMNPNIPISPVEYRGKRDYFSHHHRRNSIALKFKSPKSMGDYEH